MTRSEEKERLLQLSLQLESLLEDYESQDVCRALGSVVALHLALVDDQSFEAWIKLLREARNASWERQKPLVQ